MVTHRLIKVSIKIRRAKETVFRFQCEISIEGLHQQNTKKKPQFQQVFTPQRLNY